MKKKISELKLYEIDYLVALAEKLKPIINENMDCIVMLKNDNPIIRKYADFISYSPTTNPSQAWPIIEREGIDLTCDEDIEQWMSGLRKGNKGLIYFGKTSLESSMRWYLYSIYGEEVEI